MIHSAIPSMMTSTGGEERCQISAELFANILHASGTDRKTLLSAKAERGDVTVRGW